MNDNPPLSLHHVTLAYGAALVLEDMSLEIRRGEFVVLVGPSGCGKTTLLQILSGHLAPTDGRIERSGIIRTVYQDDGLFPWLTVAENIEMGLRGIPDPAERRRQQNELTALIRL